MSLTPDCIDGRVRAVRPNPNATGEARIIYSNPAGPMPVPSGDVVRVSFFQGGGWPTVIPSGCRLDESDIARSFEHYICAISSPLPPSASAVVEFVFEVEGRWNPSISHQAAVLVPSGFVDPGIGSNNSAKF